jgi:hypothetical protein
MNPHTRATDATSAKTRLLHERAPHGRGDKAANHRPWSSAARMHSRRNSGLSAALGVSLAAAQSRHGPVHAPRLMTIWFLLRAKTVVFSPSRVRSHPVTRGSSSASVSAMSTKRSSLCRSAGKAMRTRRSCWGTSKPAPAAKHRRRALRSWPARKHGPPGRLAAQSFQVDRKHDARVGWKQGQGRQGSLCARLFLLGRYLARGAPAAWRQGQSREQDRHGSSAARNGKCSQVESRIEIEQ